MTTLTDQIDRFVRWFFNSSPEALVDSAPRRRPSARASAQSTARSPALPVGRSRDRRLELGEAAGKGEP